MDNHLIGYLIAGGIISFGLIYHSVAWRYGNAKPLAKDPCGTRS